MGILIVAANFRTRNIPESLCSAVVDEFWDNVRLIRLLLRNPTAFRKYRYVGTREIEEIEKGNVIDTWRIYIDSDFRLIKST